MVQTLQTHKEDLEIVASLLQRDEAATRKFFFHDCRDMLVRVIKKVFYYQVEYDELINLLYLYVMENDAYRLRQYAGRSSIYQWLQTTATRFFINRRDQVIENVTHEPPIVETPDEPCDEVDENEDADIRTIRRAFDRMPNRRYAHVLQRLVIDEAPPLDVAAEMGVTVDNLYNIKKRAIAQLTQELTKLGIRRR